MQICDKNINIYFTHIPADCGIELFKKFLLFLNNNERERYNRFRFEKSKIEFLVGRVLLKKYIADYLAISPTKITFDKNEYGKLYLSHTNRLRCKGIKFNLSHSSLMVAMAMTPDHEVGIDVEKCDKDQLNLAKKFFTPNEVSFIINNKKINQIRSFYMIWTLKEAYIKAKAKGMSIPLKNFSVAVDNVLQDYVTDVKLFHFEPIKDYLLSVAIETKRSLRWTIQLHEVFLNFENAELVAQKYKATNKI